MKRSTHPIEVLLIEDDPADARLTLESLAGSKIRNRVQVVHTGAEALELLLQPDRKQRVDLILLDLNLPGMYGTEVLEQLKRHPETRRIPVVILPTSDEERDIVRSYELAASAYVNKPLGLSEFSDVVRAIEQFWFEIVLYAPDRDES